MSPPALVTLHVWTLPTRRIPWALTRMATDRGRLRRAPGVSFAKLLGTGDPRTFLPQHPTPRRWALLTCWDTDDHANHWEHGPIAQQWQAVADETWRLELAPLSSRGRWSRREPFGPTTARPHDGKVAVLTRARLRVRTAPRFYRAVPPVAAELQSAAGLRFATGIGESPIGVQGTFSLWESATAVRDFAYASAHHVQAIADTSSVGWYAEDLFARFAVLASSGTLDGRDPAA